MKKKVWYNEFNRKFTFKMAFKIFLFCITVKIWYWRTYLLDGIRVYFHSLSETNVSLELINCSKFSRLQKISYWPWIATADSSPHPKKNFSNNSPRQETMNSRLALIKSSHTDESNPVRDLNWDVPHKNNLSEPLSSQSCILEYSKCKIMLKDSVAAVKNSLEFRASYILPVKLSNLFMSVFILRCFIHSKI